MNQYQITEFLKNIRSSKNTDLIYQYQEMTENKLSGVTDDMLENIKNEIVTRFLAVNWSLMEEIAELIVEKEPGVWVIQID